MICLRDLFSRRNRAEVACLDRQRRGETETFVRGALVIRDVHEIFFVPFFILSHCFDYKL